MFFRIDAKTFAPMSQSRQGHVSLRLGHCLFHGLTLSDAVVMAREFGGKWGASAHEAPHGLSFADAMQEDDQDLLTFASWFDTLSTAQRSSLPPPLRNAARNLVRHRGVRAHKVTKGRCAQITKEIVETLDAKRIVLESQETGSEHVSTCAGSDANDPTAIGTGQWQPLPEKTDVGAQVGGLKCHAATQALTLDHRTASTFTQDDQDSIRYWSTARNGVHSRFHGPVWRWFSLRETSEDVDQYIRNATGSRTFPHLNPPEWRKY